MIINEETLAHYGTPRHSGRYKWGSGGDENTRNRDFLGLVGELEAKGLSQVEIAKAMGFATYHPNGDLKSSGTSEFRTRKTIATNAQRAALATQAERLLATGMSRNAVAKEMGLPNESSVRSLIAPGTKEKNAIIHSTREVIRAAVEKHGIVDIGAGVEKRMGVSRTKFDAAVSLLVEEGYNKHRLPVPQLGTPYDTNFKVLTKKGMEWKEAAARKHEIEQITDYSQNGGESFNKIHYPEPVSSRRVAVRWAEDGGGQADGMIYIRPGAKNLSLGHANYAQVRVNVDDTHFLKGMAMYKDDLPPGVDIEFHTSKRKADSKTGNKLDAMKVLEKDADGNVDFLKSIQRQRGALNIISEEGDWDTWAGNLSSQMLSKQKASLAKQQLDMTYEHKKSSLHEIEQITNPILRKRLLEQFAEDVDSSAVELEAAGIKDTAAHVILPLSKIKETEIYAPNFKNGTRVALVRHPHGGIFEIPNLVVNNNNPAAKKAFGNARDAVGIHHKVAEQLSGADFDGDHVLVIPNNRGQVKHAPTLEALKGFDAKHLYPKYEGMPKMTDLEKQKEMGSISNLITDMTIKGANQDEIARAIKHSMVVIDAQKHELNYKQSEVDHGIKELKTKWQKEGRNRGASTLISRAGAEVRIPERKQGFLVDKKTGAKIFRETGRMTIDKSGNPVPKMQKSKRLAETSNAHTLVGKNPTIIETIYADHSNRLKAMANDARKTALLTKGRLYNKEAAAIHNKEVASLKSKLTLAQQKAPLERQAQVIGNALLKVRVNANPNMTKETKKKLKFQILKEARERTGATKSRIEITPPEWKAIQDGAITNTMLSSILDHADMDQVKKLATPKTQLKMTDSKTSRATTMLSQGYTQAAVAEALGVSLTTLKTALKGA